MDPFTLGFYAVVCGCLSVAAPWLGRPPVRLVVGALVGVIAAVLLPAIRGLFGS